MLARVIDAVGEQSIALRKRKRRVPDDAYGALVRAICGQQLSTKAAATIYSRLLALFGGHPPGPEQVLATDPQELRSVGLSNAKTAYLRDLAEHIVDGELPIDNLAELPDAEVYDRLTAVKGLGRWTVDMFMIFHLGRPDILPVGDLGIRKAIQIHYRLDELPRAAQMLAIAEPWRPQRTLASLYLWESLGNAPD